MTPILGYWKTRGLGQQIRFLLEYTGENYEDRLYEMVPDRSTWLSVKYTLDLPYPNLPYYIDGDVKISQSDAIMRYIAEKHLLGGTDCASRAKLGMINGTILDLRKGYLRVVYGDDYDKIRPTFVADLPAKLKVFDDKLATQKWISGDDIAYPDFNFYDLLDVLRNFETSCLNQFTHLKRFMSEFENLERIKKYLASDRCIKRPFNGRIAKWGGQD